jgi:hypothetical protein
MRVMILHKSTPDTEAGIPPSACLVGDVGKMIGDMKQAGIFRDGAGLRASSLGVRLTFAGGKRTIVEGPLVGRNEDPAALCVLKVHSREEAVDYASQFAAILGDGEVDIRPVTEPWDIGFGEKPKDDPFTRYMLVWKKDAKTEAGTLPALQARAAIGKLLMDLKAQGVFQQGDLFRPTAAAKRMPFAPGKRHVIDGPFAESKELISGFVTLEVPTVADALPWADRYIAAVGDVSLDVRPLYELSELRPDV